MSKSSHATADAAGQALCGRSTVALDELAAELVLLRQVDRQRAKLDALRTRLQKQIKNAMGAAEVGTIAGVPVVTYKTVLSIVLDQSALKARYPEVLRDCEDITEARRFVLLKAAP